MAFTRKALEAMGIEPAKVDQIMDLHVEVVEALKNERDAAKAQADKLAQLETENANLKKQVAGDFETKYNAEHEAFEAYKKQQAEQAVLAEKRSLYGDMLKKIGIDETRIPAVLRVTDFNSIEVKDHAFAKAADVEAAATKDWAAFIAKPGTQGAKIDNPGNATPTGRAAWDAMSLSDRMTYANEHPAEAAEYLKK